MGCRGDFFKMYGVVLEGGGARGAYQVGVWKALRDLGIEYRGVAGASVGAINGAMMIQGDLERAIDIWSSLTPSQVVRLEDAAKDGVGLLHALKALFREGGMDITPLRLLLEGTIEEERIRGRGIVFGLITISLPDFQPLRIYLEDIPEGRLVDYLLASANLPLFKRQNVDGRTLLDGGVYDNLPLSLLTERGFKRIIAVRLTRRDLPRWKAGDGIEITVIRPRESLGGILEFSGKRAQRNILLGYYDALRVLKGYAGRRYCIELLEDDEYFFEMLLRIDERRLRDAAGRLGFPESIPVRRLLLERLVPIAFELLGLSPSASYSELVIALLERAAERLGIERFRVYTYSRFYEEVSRRWKAFRAEKRPVLPRIFKGSELVLKAMGEQVLDELTGLLLGR